VRSAPDEARVALLSDIALPDGVAVLELAVEFALPGVRFAAFDDGVVVLCAVAARSLLLLGLEVLLDCA